MSFLKSVLNNYKKVGAISPSSRFLYKKMAHSLDLSHDIHIIEFWAGNGIFTDELLKQITPNSKLSIFEIEPLFIAHLREKYLKESRVTLYDVGAEESNNLFDPESIDYVLSSLPLAFIEKKVVIKILTNAKYLLKENGKFLQFQYFLQNKKNIENVFSHVKYKFTFFNIPPAFIYICKK